MEVQTDRNEAILSLWAQGNSHGRIVLLLNQQGYNLTRSMVAGIIHRAGKTRNGTRSSTILYRNASPAGKALQAKVPKRSKPPSELNTNVPEAIGPIEDFPVDGFCHHLEGDVQTPGWRYCGQPTNNKRAPYCDFHNAHIHHIDRRTAAGRQQKAARQA